MYFSSNNKATKEIAGHGFMALGSLGISARQQLSFFRFFFSPSVAMALLEGLATTALLLLPPNATKMSSLCLLADHLFVFCLNLFTLSQQSVSWAFPSQKCLVCVLFGSNNAKKCFGELRVISFGCHKSLVLVMSLDASGCYCFVLFYFDDNPPVVKFTFSLYFQHRNPPVVKFTLCLFRCIKKKKTIKKAAYVCVQFWFAMGRKATLMIPSFLWSYVHITRLYGSLFYGSFRVAWRPHPWARLVTSPGEGVHISLRQEFFPSD